MVILRSQYSPFHQAVIWPSGSVNLIGKVKLCNKAYKATLIHTGVMTARHSNLHMTYLHLSMLACCKPLPLYQHNTASPGTLRNRLNKSHAKSVPRSLLKRRCQLHPLFQGALKTPKLLNSLLIRLPINMSPPLNNTNKTSRGCRKSFQLLRLRNLRLPL